MLIVEKEICWSVIVEIKDFLKKDMEQSNGILLLIQMILPS
jgi:hypothetical protein